MKTKGLLIANSGYKVAILSALALIFLILGCREEIVPPAPEPEPAYVYPTARVYTQPTGIIMFGDSVTIVWETENIVSGKLLNSNSTINVNDSLKIKSLTCDTIFYFDFNGKDGEIIQRSVNVKINMPPVVVRTRADTLCERYWIMTKESKHYHADSDYWYTPPSKDHYNTRCYYHKSGNDKWIYYEEIDIDGFKWGPYTIYWIGQDSMLIGDQRRKFELINDSTYILSERNGTMIHVYRGYKL